MTVSQFLIPLSVAFLGAILSSPQPNPETEVRALLARQQDAWNRHDLEGFMEGYWKSDDLTFFSGAKVTRGWQPTLDRYRQHYQAPGTEMGKLEFRSLSIEMLGNDGAFARGEYWLTLSSGKTPHGIFTLVIRRFPEGWRVVHDHTSAAE